MGFSPRGSHRETTGEDNHRHIRPTIQDDLQDLHDLQDWASRMRGEGMDHVDHVDYFTFFEKYPTPEG